MPMYPRDRLLAFLAKIAGETGPDLEPRDWLEYYLDKIAENGGSSGGDGGVMVVNSVQDSPTTTRLDKTFREIADALQSNIPVFYMGASGTISGNYLNAECRQVTFVFVEYDVFEVDAGDYRFLCNAPDEYPVLLLGY